MGKKLIIYFRLISKCQRTLGTFSVPSWVTPYAERSGVRGSENDKNPYLSPQPEGLCRSFAFALGFTFFPLLGGQRGATR